VLGVKINAADYIDHMTDDPLERERDAKGGAEAHAMKHVCTMAQWSNIDFIEISGGDYEDPGELMIYMRSFVPKSKFTVEFMRVHDESPTSPRRALFSDISFRILKVLQSLPRPTPLVLLTGGLRTPALLHSALESEHTHLLGIGRGSVLCPNMPDVLRDRACDDHAPLAPEPHLFINKHWPSTWLPKIRLIGAGIGMAWYVVRIRYIALATTIRGPHSDVGGIDAIVRMWLWSGYGDATLRRLFFCGLCMVIGITILWTS
jgi:hypothetical protein